MTPLFGKTISYTYENGDSHRVHFSGAGATWTAMTGFAAGSSGTECYDCAQGRTAATKTGKTVDKVRKKSGSTYTCIQLS